MPFELLVKLNDDQTLSIGGNAIANKLVAYGLLELAREAVNEYHAEQQKRIVQPAAFPLPPFGGQ